MADIINLRTARKQKARAEREAQAAQNRALFGRTKGERLRQAAEKSLAERHVDAHKKDESDQ
jgi:hypothetical protein